MQAETDPLEADWAADISIAIAHAKAPNIRKVVPPFGISIDIAPATRQPLRWPRRTQSRATGRQRTWQCGWSHRRIEPTGRLERTRQQSLLPRRATRCDTTYLIVRGSVNSPIHAGRT